MASEFHKQPDHKLNEQIMVKSALPHVCYCHFGQASCVATSIQGVRKRPSINRGLQSHIFFHEYKSESVRHSDMSESFRPHRCSPLGFFVSGIFLARILECFAIPSLRGDLKAAAAAKLRQSRWKLIRPKRTGKAFQAEGTASAEVKRTNEVTEGQCDWSTDSEEFSVRSMDSRST